MLIVTSLTLVLVYLASQYLMAMPYSIIPSALLLLVPTGSHARFIAFLTVLNLLLLFNYIRTRNRLWFTAIAISAGASLYFRRDAGSFAIASTGLMILLQKFYHTGNFSRDKTYSGYHISRELICFLLFTMLVLSPVIIYSLMHPEFFYDQLYYFRLKKGVFNTPNPFLYFSSKDVGTKTLFEGMLFYYPFGVYIAMSTVLIYKFAVDGKEQVNGYLLAIVIFGFLTLSYPLWSPDIWHSLGIYPLVFIMTGYFLYIIGKKVKHIMDSRLFSSFALCFIPLSFAFITIPNYGFIFGSIGVMRGDHKFLNIERANIFVPSEKHRVIMGIVDYIKENSSKDDGLFVVPHEVMWYFLSERKNPTAYDYLLPGMIDNVRQLKIVEALTKNMPKFIIYQDTSLNGKDENRLENFARHIYDFIINNYIPVKQVGEYTIFLQNSYGSFVNQIFPRPFRL